MTDDEPLLVISIRDAGDHWTVAQGVKPDLSLDEACGITQLAMDTAAKMHDAVHILDGMKN
jgi:hypothetical protein